MWMITQLRFIATGTAFDPTSSEPSTPGIWTHGSCHVDNSSQCRVFGAPLTRSEIGWPLSAVTGAGVQESGSHSCPERPSGLPTAKRWAVCAGSEAAVSRAKTASVRRIMPDLGKSRAAAFREAGGVLVVGRTDAVFPRYAAARRRSGTRVPVRGAEEAMGDSSLLVCPDGCP